MSDFPFRAESCGVRTAGEGSPGSSTPLLAESFAVCAFGGSPGSLTSLSEQSWGFYPLVVQWDP